MADGDSGGGRAYQWRDAAEAKDRAVKLRDDAQSRQRSAEEGQAATEKHQRRRRIRRDEAGC